MRRFVTCLLLLVLWGLPAYAKDDDTQRVPIVRDAEIESILSRWAAPMYKAAGFNPRSMRVILVPDPDLNAFTAGGLSIFMTTGLIMAADSPDEIVGVLAHETGHIAGGHILSLTGTAKNASYESIIGTVLGMGVGLLTGSGDAASAVSMMSTAHAYNNLLSHSRLEESSADQAALSFLRQGGMPVAGLVSFMHKLEDQELLPPAQQRPFARTHPITRDRIAALQYRTEKYKSDPMPEKNVNELKRVKAKLEAFINPARAMNTYAKGDDAIPIMARAMATYQQNRITEALKLADQWLALEPDNPYAYELKGQILKDGNRPADAAPVYEKALALAPQAALIRIDAAHAMLESGNDALVDKSIGYLNMGLQSEPRSTLAYRLLSTAYGKKHMEPEAQIYLAELALLQGQKKRAKQLVGLAYPRLLANSPVRRRASDLKLQLDTLDTKDEDK